MNRIDGKVAVITGGTQGLGAAIANLFAKAGAIPLNASSFSPENTIAGISNGATASIVSIKPSWVVGRYPLYIRARLNVLSVFARYTGIIAAPCEYPKIA